MLTFLLLCLCADPATETLPDNFRAYFKRVDDVRASTIHDIQNQITDRQIDLRSASILRTQNLLKRDIAKLEKQLADIKKQKAFAFVPNPTVSKAGDIGILRPGEISRAVTDTTAVVIVRMKYSDATTAGTFAYVLTSIDSKPLKAGKPYSSSDLWIVVSTQTTDNDLLRQLPGEFAIVKPVPKDDVARYEALYAAEPKAQK